MPSSAPNKLTLYFAPGASSMAVHIALHEIGVPFEGRPISLAKREQQGPQYLALNSEGKVPTLTIDGRPLTEVAAILLALCQFRQTSAWNIPPACRPLRAHDDAAGGQADLRDRSRDRL